MLDEAESVLSISHRLRKKFRNSTSDVKEELYEFTNSVIDNFPKFSVARFFEIRRSNLLNILGTVATFLIIMIQFRGKHDE